jgi:hypothetical protein
VVLKWLDDWASPRLAEINSRWQGKIEAKTKGKAETLKYEKLHFSILTVGLRRRCVARKILTFHQDTGERENQETSRAKKRKHGTGWSPVSVGGFRKRRRISSRTPR